jgi:hypothetical protein
MMAAASQLVADCFHNRDNREEEKSLRLSQLSLKSCPKYTPKRIKLANPKTSQSWPKESTAGSLG